MSHPLAVLLFLFVPQAADAAPRASAEPVRKSEVNLSAVGGTPTVLQGVATGLALEGQRELARWPLFLAARLQWTEASGANESWIIDHHQFVFAGALGTAATVGVARLWAELGGGAEGLYEVLSNHQIQRIQAAGVPGGTHSALAVGPYAFGEAGVGLVLRGFVRGFVAAGPTVTRTNVEGAALWRFGGMGRLGVAYDF